MLRNLIVLPDGTELYSGTGTQNAIKTSVLTFCVNNGEELTLGSVCSNMMEISAITPNKGLTLTAGDEVTLYKVDDAGERHKVGPFTLEKPTRPSANTLKLTGYDRVAKLDKDLTAWLNSLTGWPYALLTFAGMVCEACGLTLATTDIPNADVQVQKITREATGRQLMSWIGEACCRFCRANSDGEIEFAWYTPAGVSITPTGDHYYFQKGLSYEDYQVAPIEAVQLRLANSDEGALWPAVDEGVNSYIVTDNPILMASITADTTAVLQTTLSELASVTYTPCKVSIPATLDIQAGNTVQITDSNGVTITAYVMTKTQKGQRDTLQCTGSPRRDSVTATNNRKTTYPDAASLDKKLDQLELLKRLTKEWADDGIYLTDDGKLAINASAVLTGVLKASLIDADNLKIKAANITGGLVANKLTVLTASGATLLSAGDNAVTIGGWKVAENGLWKSTEDGQMRLIPAGNLSSSFTVNGLTTSQWVILCGPDNSSVANFGVTKNGSLYASNANIKGKINASGGAVGCWNINSGGLWTGSSDGSTAGVSLGAQILYTSIGSGWRQSYWYQIHNCVSDWVENSSSDIAVKNSVSGIDVYDTMFDQLKPCRYKYNYGTSGRYHTGFIAQEVAEAIETAGMTTQDFAGVVHLEQPNENGSEWLLRRDEFVALNTWQIQKLKERVAALEAIVGATAA